MDFQYIVYVLCVGFKGYLLKASEQAAAEKQPVIHVPTVDKAGKARQLRAAPIVCVVCSGME